MSWGQAKKNNEPGLTAETQQLLNGILSERGLSLRAKQDVTNSIKGGSSQWVQHLNSGTSAFRPATSKSSQLVKAPKVGQGAKVPALPARFSGIKLQHEIMRDTPPQRDIWIGGAPPTNREAEKDRLSKIMEVGPRGVQALQEQGARSKAQAAQQACATQVLDPKEQLIDQIIDEIKERREFLESMRALGKAKEWEGKIKGEIAQRLSELDKLGMQATASRHK